MVNPHSHGYLMWPWLTHATMVISCVHGYLMPLWLPPAVSSYPQASMVNQPSVVILRRPWLSHPAMVISCGHGYLMPLWLPPAVSSIPQASMVIFMKTCGQLIGREYETDIYCIWLIYITTVVWRSGRMPCNVAGRSRVRFPPVVLIFLLPRLASKVNYRSR